MKKLIAILAAAIMVFSIAACGSINDKNIAILWQGSNTASVPGTLIDTMERAMYTENISYVHYGAQGDSKAQLEQAEKAVKEGCAALMVNLVDAASAQQIVDIAKEKDVPVVFFDCEVEDSVLNGYDKAACVSTDIDSVASVQGKLIKEYIEKNTDKKGNNKLDRNNDGKISYAAFGEVEATVKATELDLELIEDPQANGDKVELIITDKEETALELLKKLWEKEYNNKMLKTHFIPLFTVGSDADASEFYDGKELEEDELETFVYTVTEIIGKGRIAGTAIVDRDGISAAAAKITKNLIKGNDIFDSIAEENVSGNKNVKIPYTYLMAKV